jgi:hypothetical protein
MNFSDSPGQAFRNAKKLPDPEIGNFRQGLRVAAILANAVLVAASLDQSINQLPACGWVVVIDKVPNVSSMRTYRTGVYSMRCRDTPRVHRPPDVVQFLSPISAP